MRKLLAIIVLSLLLNNKSFGYDLKLWDKYIDAYQEAHSECTSEWFAIGNFKSNPKVLLDVELCTAEKDEQAIETYLLKTMKISNINSMELLRLKKGSELWEAARETSLDILQNRNYEANVKRLFKKRRDIKKKYLRKQLILYTN